VETATKPRRADLERLLRDEDVEDWLRLWWVSQGGEHRNRRFERIAELLPFEPGDAIDVLDLCCGPGDLGRFIHARFPKARLDCVDRDPFLLALGGELNRRRGIAARLFERDGWDAGWARDLRGDYHVVAASTALHWFDERRLGEIFRDCRGLLRAGGVLVFSEPASAEPPFEPGLARCRAREAAGYDMDDTWRAFWVRAERLLGFDYRPFLEALPAGRRPIGDDGIPVLRYVELLRGAGFERADVLHREARMATFAAIRD
jgi:SAM-dependent methyltransferase